MPVRYRLVAVTFTLSMLLYLDRIAISTARDPLSSELQLTDTQFGWVLSAFALGYALFQTPAGAFADRAGPRLALTSMVVSWSVFTGLTAAASSFIAMLAIRFLFGVGEAGAYPTIARAFYNWLPAGERGLAQGINFSGSRLGAAFALPAVAWLITRVGWRDSFIMLGAIGCLWAAAWWIWFRDRPEEHRQVSASERDLIVAARGARAQAADHLSATGLLGSANMRLAMGQYFASNYTFFFCLTWLFPFLQRTYRLDPVEAGVMASAPLVAGACGNWAGGAMVDRLYKRGLWRSSRQWPAIAGFLLAAVGLLASLAVSDPLSAVVCLSIAVFGADMTLPPSWAFCIDIGQEHAGAVAGTMNMAGNIGSFVTSLAFPYLLLLSGSTSSFFVLGAALNVIAAWLWTRAQPETRVSSSGVLVASGR